MVALLGVIAPLLLAVAAIATLLVNKRINTKTADRGDFDSIVAGYKGLYEQVSARLASVESEVVLLRAEVVVLRAENVQLRVRLGEGPK